MTQITNPREKLTAALGAFMFIIPHFFGKKTEFVTFYMRQSFSLYILMFLFKIIGSIFGIIPIFGGFLMMIITLILFAILATLFFLTYHAYIGEKFEIKSLVKIADSIIVKIDFLKDFFTPKN